MTGIEWTDAVWNPTTGCDRVSPGCDHCYAMTMAKRLKGMGSAKYQNDGDPRTSGPGFGVTPHHDVIAAPLKWRKPKRIFVNSMSDLFHAEIPWYFLDEAFGVMAVAHQLHGHTFQILTKRHSNMRSYFRGVMRKLPGGYMGTTRQAIAGAAHRWAIDRVNAGALSDAIEDGPAWPLPGIWLGVSVEDQKWADIRIPALLETPAAVRWLSCEPLLGALNLQAYLNGMAYASTAMGRGAGGQTMTQGPGLDWVVVGGESGKGARPMEPSWATSLRDQCLVAGVPFFFKQWGEYVPPDHMTDDTFMSWDVENGTSAYDRDQPWRVGKKAAGRLLDGELHDAYPAVAS
jgi:protein gp37